MLQPAKDKTKILYAAVSKDYDIGTYDEFKVKLSDPEKRKAFYEGVGKEFELGTYEEFEAKVTSVKKKDNSTSSSAIPKSASAPQNGSSAGSPQNITPDKKYAEGSMEWNMEKLAQTKNWIALDNEVKVNTQISPERKKEIQQEVEDEANNEGFWNKFDRKSKEVYNSLSDGLGPFSRIFGIGNKVETDPLAKEKKEAVKVLTQKGYKQSDINNDLVKKTAISLKANKLIASEEDSKMRDYLSSTEDDYDVFGLSKKDKLESQATVKTIGKQQQKTALEKQINIKDGVVITRKNNIEQINKSIIEYQKKGEQIPAELIEKQKNELSLFQSSVKESIAVREKFVDTDSELSDAKSNLDYFKRDYGKLNNLWVNLSAATTDLVAGGINAVDYGLNVKQSILGENGTDKLLQSGTRYMSALLKDINEEERAKIAKPIKVDDIHSMNDFGRWMGYNVLATQVPIFATIATGTPGIAALGISATGQKYDNMLQEMNPENLQPGQTIPEYSDAEMVFKPLGYGVTETASAMVDKLVLGNASKILKAATEPERQMIAKGISGYFMDISKSVGKNALYEGADEGLTQGFQNLIDGKPFMDNMKDPIAAGALMGALIPLSSHIVAAATKPFSVDANIQKASNEILSLESELDKATLPETREIIQMQIAQKKSTVESLLKKQIANIESLSKNEFDEIIRLEKAQQNIKNQVDNIKSDTSISDEMTDKIVGNLKAEFDANEARRKEILTNAENAVAQPNAEEEAVSTGINPVSTEPAPVSTEPTVDNTVVNEPETTEENETAPTNVITPDGEVRPGDNTEAVPGENNDLQPPADNADGKGKNEVNIYEQTVEELEKRQLEIETSTNPDEKAEFNRIDTELEKREWQSVLNSPLEDVSKIIDSLIDKEKEKPNGFGAYIEKKDARETKEVAEKYSNTVSKNDAKKDFEDAFFGNPDKWYADGLKLRESVRAFVEHGGTFKELLVGIQKQFESDGFTEQDAAEVVKNKLDKIGRVNSNQYVEDVNSKGIDVGSYNYSFENGEWTAIDKTGNPKPKEKNSKYVPEKALQQHADNFDFTTGETAINMRKIQDVSTWEEDIATHSQNPVEVAETLLNARNIDSTEGLDPKSVAIAEAMGIKGVERDSFLRFGDRNSITGSIGLQYFSKKGQGKGIDIIAQEAEQALYGDNDNTNPNITTDDVIDFINDNPAGVDRFLNGPKKDKINALKAAFTNLTGLPANDKYLTKAIEQARSREKFLQEYGSELDFLSDEELLSLQADLQQSQIQEYEEISNNTRTEGKPQTPSGQEGAERSTVQSESGQNDSAGQRNEKSGSGINSEQASTQDRTSALATERIKPERRTAKNPPKKLNQIIADAAKALKATLVYGRSRRARSLGTYNSSNTLTRLTRAGDIDTAAHELGHFLDDRFDILNTVPSANEIDVDRQLKWFSDRGGSNPPGKLSPEKKAEYLQREGLAEFIRAYISNPNQAKLIAPELFSHFENTLHTEALAAVKQMSEDYLDYANASYGEQILSNVENSTLPDKKGFREWLNRFKDNDGRLNITPWDNLNSVLFNSMAKANKAFYFATALNNDVTLLPENNFELLSRVFAGINGKTSRVLSDGMIDGKNNIITDSEGNPMTINWLLEPLDSTDQETVYSDMNETISLLIAERTLEYAKKFGRLDNLTGIGAGVNSDIDVAQGFINQFNELENTNKEKFNRINVAAERYREYADAGLKYAVEKGRISEETYNLIKASNKYYVSLARINELSPTEEAVPFFNEMAGGITSVKDVFKKAKGGSKFIQNPYESLIMNTVNIIKEADRNEVVVSFIEPLSKIRAMGDGPAVDFSQVARPASTGDKNTKSVFVDGKEQRWQFSSDIYNAITGLEGDTDGLVTKIFRAPADLIRFTVTNFPTFALRNVVRDTQSRMAVSRTGSGLRDFAQNATDRELFELYGGSQAGYYLTDRDSYKEKMNETVKQITKSGGIMLNPASLWKGYKKLLEKGESVNRIAEFKSAFRKAQAQGLDEYNAGLYAAYQARDLMDFAVAGHAIRSLNKFIPFLNAGVQGLVRTKKAATEDPAGFALRTALYTILPTIMFRLIVTQMGDDDEYEELPEYQRDLAYNFKTPFTGDVWISIPKAYDQAFISAAVDRAVSQSKGYENAWSGYSGSLAKSLIPVDESSFLGGLKPIVEVNSNYDFFRESPIVSPWEEGKLPELQKGQAKASRTGQFIRDGFKSAGMQVDPRDVDHIIKGYGTYMGDWAISLGDLGVEGSRNRIGPSKTGFARDVPISNARSVKAVYELSTELGKWSSKQVKRLRAMIDDYYEEEDAAKKKEISREIYKYAQEVKADFEEEKKEIQTKNKKRP